MKEEKQITRAERVSRAKRLVAKFKPWFGADTPDLFNTDKYEIEQDASNSFIYVFTKEEVKE